MKRNLFLIPIIGALVSCGGSGGSSSEEPMPVITENTAPVLSGELNISATAGVESRVVYTLEDQENDTVTVTIDNLPSWASYSVSANQLELTANASLFDIATHDFQVTLSDSEKSTSYDFKIIVDDNPDIWQDIILEESDLAGLWQTANEKDAFQFFKDGTGVYLDNDEFKIIEWNSNPQYGTSVQVLSCFDFCNDRDDIDFQVIAHQDNRLRLYIVDEEAIETTIIVEKRQQVEISDNYYAEWDPGLLLSYVSKFDLDNQTAVLDLELPQITLGGSLYLKLPVIVKGELSGNQIIVEDPVLREDLTSTFSLKNGDEGDSLYFDLVVKNMEVIPSVQNNIAIEIDYEFELASELGDLSYEEFVGQYASLENVLEQESTTTVLLTEIEPAQVPANLSQNTFQMMPISRYLADAKAELGLDFGGYNYYFSDDATGHIEIPLSHLEQYQTVPFTWSSSEQELELTFAGETYSLPVFQLPSGQLAVLQTVIDADGEQSQYLQSMTQLENKQARNFSQEDYLQTFVDLTYDGQFDNQDEVSVVGDKIFIGFRDYFYTFEVDGSLSLLNENYCPGTSDYEACLAIAKDPSNTSNTYLSTLQLERIDGDLYYFSRISQQLNVAEGGTISQFKRIYQKQ